MYIILLIWWNLVDTIDLKSIILWCIGSIPIMSKSIYNINKVMIKNKDKFEYILKKIINNIIFIYIY